MFFFSNENRFKKLEKSCNDRYLHPYKVNVICFRSTECLNELKTIQTIEELSKIQAKLYNDSSLNFLFNRWNPDFIWVSMHEIYVVKFYEEDDDYTVLYNGNVNKVLTTLTSGLSIALNLELSASFVEFDDDRDIYDFLTIKKKECYKNLMNIIWMKFLGPRTTGMYPSLIEIEEILNKNDYADLKMSLRENFKKGMCIKHLTKKMHKIPKDWTMMMTNDTKNKFVYFIM